MGAIRLQLHLARAGAMSRRHAEQAIVDGRVAVNGEVVTELGSKVDPARDVVELDGETVRGAEPSATLMMFKPDAVMSTLQDPEGRQTVKDLLEDEPYRFVPVGRLDYHTEGLLLMSTDGELVHRLLHPRFHVPKSYRVRVKGQVRPETLDRLRDGVELEDGPTRPAIVEIIEGDDRATWLEIIVTEGRNRLIRRMCEVVGHEARRVVRTEFGTLGAHDLSPGQYRYLSEMEMEGLYRAVDLDVPGLPPRFEQVGLEILGRSRRGRGPVPGMQEREWTPPSQSSEPGARRRIATRGRAKPPETPPDFELPRTPRGPRPEDRSPDGVPARRKEGYPDTRIWRSERTRTANRRPLVEPVTAERRPRYAGRPDAKETSGARDSAGFGRKPRADDRDRVGRSGASRSGPSRGPRGRDRPDREDRRGRRDDGPPGRERRSRPDRDGGYGRPRRRRADESSFEPSGRTRRRDEGRGPRREDREDRGEGRPRRWSDGEGTRDRRFRDDGRGGEPRRPGPRGRGRGRGRSPGGRDGGRGVGPRRGGPRAEGRRSTGRRSGPRSDRPRNRGPRR